MNQYCIVRNDYLQHWGIKGQKWGVRRFENLDGTLTPAGKERYNIGGGGNKKLDNKYKKEIQKLNRLLKYADVDIQKKNIDKYNKRANLAFGIGGAGVGAALGGYFGLKGALKKIGSDRANFVTDLKSKHSNAVSELITGMINDKNPIWNEMTSDGKPLGDHYIDLRKELLLVDYKDKLSEGTKKFNQRKLSATVDRDIQVASGLAIAAVSFGIAGYNKIQANLSKKRVTQIGHAKSVKAYKNQVEKMMNTFGGTKYKQFLKAEVDQYKELHPNSQMSDSDIEKMLG